MTVRPVDGQADHIRGTPQQGVQAGMGAPRADVPPEVTPHLTWYTGDSIGTRELSSRHGHAARHSQEYGVLTRRFMSWGVSACTSEVSTGETVEGQRVTLCSLPIGRSNRSRLFGKHRSASEHECSRSR